VTLGPALGAPEEVHAAELEALARVDVGRRLPGWGLTPSAVLRFLLGGVLVDGREVAPKVIGVRVATEVAVAALSLGRPVMIAGPAGYGRRWLSAHLAAAVSGDSGHVVHSGELSGGADAARSLPSSLATAMRLGVIARLDAVHQISPHGQAALSAWLGGGDAGREVAGGFSLIGTTNPGAPGANVLSGALRRRFVTVRIGPPRLAEVEVQAVVARLAPSGDDPVLSRLTPGALRGLVDVVRTLRAATTPDGLAVRLATGDIVAIVQRAGDGVSEGEDVGVEHLAAQVVAHVVRTDADRALLAHVATVHLAPRRRWAFWARALRARC